MKRLIKYIILVCCICLLNACEETKEKGNKPDPIVKYEIIPIHGGAIVNYSIPADPEILYVMAEYERNGNPFTERSSYHNNSITIQGFNTTGTVNAVIYTVNRHEVKSDPLQIAFQPLEPVVSLVRQSTKIVDGFGGIIVSWENIYEIDLAIHLMVDSLGTKIEKDVFFSSRESDTYPFRGFEPVETNYALTFSDKWGNVSDTLFYTGTPIPEYEVPKPWFDRRALIPYDNTTTSAAAAYGFPNVWDGGFAMTQRYLPLSGGSGSSMTFEFPVAVKLSRMVMWPYMHPTYTAKENVYGQVHIHVFEMWGTMEIDQSKLPPADPSYWLHPFSADQNDLEPPWQGSFADLTPEEIQELPDCFAKDWIYLGRYSIERLDLQGASDEEIWAQGERGHPFDFPDLPPVKVIRFFPIATRDASPPASNYWQICELSFWGDTSIGDK